MDLHKREGTIAFAAEYPLEVHDIVSKFTDYDFLIGLIAIRDQRYRDFFKENRNSGRYRIVDSGIFEDPQNPPTNTRLLNISLDLGADEVVPTDWINDCEATLRSMEEFLALSDTFPFKIQGVVQGKSLKEWMECLIEYNENPRVDVIGLTYFEVPDELKQIGLQHYGVPDIAEAARVHLLHLIHAGVWCDASGEYYLDKPLSKPIHLLGCRHCKALPYYRNYPLVRSIDTSFAVQLGVECQPLTMDAVKPELKVQFGGTLIRAQKALVASNVMRFRELCRGTESPTSWMFTDRVAEFS